MALAGGYAGTIRNLAVDASTKCIVQGLGKSSTFHSKLALGMGTSIVGGVGPGKGGQSYLERPVFNTVREAVHHLRPTATAVFVPPLAACGAILEAIEAEVPLIVSVAEGVPLKDQMTIMAALHSQSKSRLVGANSPGMANPRGCRLGISPPVTMAPGPVGIASRSGTLSYEAASSCKHIGQSYVLGLGGDFYPGTRTAEALSFFMDDPTTEALILVGEVGGTMEEEAAELLLRDKRYRDAEGCTRKPVVGFIAGRNVPPGKIFGHAGACWRDGLGSADQKRQAWTEAGIRVVDTIAETGAAIEEEMKKRGLFSHTSLG
ncbi:alpha subunit of succinyl-CoA ligase [Microstroma glucosiphilum]|uniref:Alpha subunit of succinyl-CoA ligase n=1 Tax=Pseudomicrostroma glucosiphilum TaxID=1684307 RepID=A0A316U6Y6_9BASI|nr:alpha subunit of succinyl-CoA ligase [Pseudomicrostroma glucosiphilum]PWN20604.1 alpha subunit of succinyl-CoA ligase [Pseudomicrostroma glucosiphilum]